MGSLKVFTTARQRVPLIYDPVEIFAAFVFPAIAAVVPPLLPSPRLAELESQESRIDKPNRPEKHLKYVHDNTS